jgi:hypothetical protein
MTHPSRTFSSMAGPARRVRCMYRVRTDIGISIPGSLMPSMFLALPASHPVIARSVIAPTAGDAAVFIQGAGYPPVCNAQCQSRVRRLRLPVDPIRAERGRRAFRHHPAPTTRHMVGSRRRCVCQRHLHAFLRPKFVADDPAVHWLSDFRSSAPLMCSLKFDPCSRGSPTLG